MARRKKKTKAIEQQITPTTIGYSGKINVNVTNRGKKVYSGTFHNIGGTKLFQFICQCLAGQYSSAESNRPVWIKLFHTDATLEDINSCIAAGNNPISTAALNHIALTDRLYMNTSAVPLQVGSENTNMSNYSVTFHFLISYAQLYNDKSINCAAIYGKNNTSINDFSALFYFTDNRTKNESDETLLPGINTTSWDKNYVLQLEWTMTLTNGQEANN